jgi:adenylate cyclase
MTDTLLSHRGTLDKYEGDAIIAFFGAPMPMADHATQACHTALQMQYKLGELRRKWCQEKCNRRCAERKCGDKCGEKDKWPQIVHNMRMRIGINTGRITTGNMGSATRMNYTMMGDAVNLAARLESAAKQYGVFTMISNFTYDMVKEDFETRLLDKITVVGKSEPVTVYELMSKKKQLSQEQAELLDVYNQGVKHYFDREFETALELFVKAEKMEPNLKDFPDKPEKPNPSKGFIERCKNYIENPPGEEWDGVTKLTSK